MAHAPADAPAIPGYRIERALGRGGMATVWLAEQLSLRRQVALKVLDRTLAREPEFVARFLGEAHLLASMQHPNIVAIHDVGEYDGAPFLAMEYLPRGSLAAVCGTLDETELLQCVRDVARALDHAHARGVVHRDVKPENIFRRDDGQCLLGDFGIARGATPTGSTTVAGRTFGTPAYMAPERWRGEPAGPRSDLYSLGITVHTLATGAEPYRGDDPLSVGMQHASAPLPILPRRFARMQGLVAGLLAKQPADRTPDADHVVRLVDALIEESETGSERASTERMLLEWPFRPSDPEAPTVPIVPATPRRQWHRIAVVAAVLAAGLLGLLGLPSRQSENPLPPPPAAPPGPVGLTVLPFAAGADEEDLERIASVLTDDVTNGLARSRGLRVTERAAAISAQNLGLDDSGVAQLLQVGYALHGELKRQGSRLRLDAQLRELPSGRERWRTRFEGQDARLWELERRVVDAVAAVLAPSSPPAPGAIEGEPPAAAFARYLKGRQLLDAPGEAVAAAQAFEAALDIDPGFSAAQVGLCQAQLREFESRREAAQFERALRSCEAALAVDAQSGEVMYALGEAQRLRGDYAQALTLYRRAEGDPAMRARALVGKGLTLARLGRTLDAEAELRASLALQPGAWRSYLALGNVLLEAGRPLEAVDTYGAALPLAPPADTSVLNNTGGALMMLDRLEDAEAAFTQSLQRRRTPSALSNLGTVKFSLGRWAEAADLYREALESSPNDYRLVGNYADSLSMNGAPVTEVEQHYRRALALGQEFLSVRNDAADTASDLAWYLANLGEAARARTLLSTVTGANELSADVTYRVALCHARLGDLDAARRWRALALQRGFSARIIAGTPLFSGLAGG